MTETQTAQRGVVPRIGTRVPAWTLRAAVAVVGLGLCFSQLPAGFWFGIGVVFAALAAVLPRIPAAWALMIMCGVCVFLHPVGPPPGTTVDWRIVALIAGVHLLHLAASFAVAFPPTGAVALRAFSASGRRYLVIQVSVQLVAAIVLYVIARASLPVVPLVGVIAAIALIGLALAVLVPLLNEKRRL